VAGAKQKQAPNPENAAKKAAKKEIRRGGGSGGGGDGETGTGTTVTTTTPGNNAEGTAPNVKTTFLKNMLGLSSTSPTAAGTVAGSVGATSPSAVIGKAVSVNDGLPNMMFYPR